MKPNEVQPDKDKAFYPDHEQELSTKRNFLDGHYDESPEGMVLRLYRQHGRPMKISHRERLTAKATNRLTVYDAVTRILKDMGKIPREAVELRLFHDLEWNDICRIVGRGRTSTHYYWRHFWNSTFDTIFDR